MEVDFRNEKAAAANFIGNLEGSYDRSHFGFAGKYLEEHDAYLYVQFILTQCQLIETNLYRYYYSKNHWVYSDKKNHWEIPIYKNNDDSTYLKDDFTYLNDKFGLVVSGDLKPNGCISNLDSIANDALKAFIEEFKRKATKK